MKVGRFHLSFSSRDLTLLGRQGRAGAFEGGFLRLELGKNLDHGALVSLERDLGLVFQFLSRRQGGACHLEFRFSPVVTAFGDDLLLAQLLGPREVQAALVQSGALRLHFGHPRRDGRQKLFLGRKRSLYGSFHGGHPLFLGRDPGHGFREATLLRSQGGDGFVHGLLVRLRIESGQNVTGLHRLIVVHGDLQYGTGYSGSDQMDRSLDEGVIRCDVGPGVGPVDE